MSASKPNVELVEPKLFAGVVADEIVASIQEAIQERGRCSVALAGGGTPSAIYRCLARPPRVSDVAWEKVSLFLGDERWVPADDNQSNFKMVSETLLSQITEAAPKAYPVDTSLPTPARGAEDYAKKIQSALGAGPNGLPVFDLVLLGIGEDGHTASLFPGSKALSDRTSIALAVQHPGDDRYRVTLGAGLLFGGRKILFMAKGEEKADIIKRVIEGDEPIEQLPACLYRNAAGQVTFFLDSSAGLKLNRSAS